MAVYEWKETETHYLAVIRPIMLFDDSTAETPDPEDHQVYLSAKHLLTQEMEGYAIAYGKGWRRDFAEAHVNSIKNHYIERDLADLERLNQNNGHRKTA
jgi:hypothetical protein